MSRRGEGAKTKPQEHKHLDSDYQLALVFPDFPEDSDILTNPPHHLLRKPVLCEKMKDSALKIAKGYYMDGGEESLATPHKGQMQEAILPPSPTTHVPPQACVFDF